MSEKRATKETPKQRSHVRFGARLISNLEQDCSNLKTLVTGPDEGVVGLHDTIAYKSELVRSKFNHYVIFRTIDLKT
jgi:hypothetical protein